jgi:DNA-directed RNA polymerase I, II, and III subunit RPABC2
MDAVPDYDDDDISSVTSDELGSEDAGSIDDDEQANIVEPIQILDDEENPDEEEEDEETFDDIEDDENVINISENHKFEIVSKDKTYERLQTRKKETSPLMNRFEVTKLIGIRAQQLACGMQPCVSFDPDITNTEFIAIQELLQKKMPLIVRRYLPNGVYEDWRVNELIIPESILY